MLLQKVGSIRKPLRWPCECRCGMRGTPRPGVSRGSSSCSDYLHAHVCNIYTRRQLCVAELVFWLELSRAGFCSRNPGAMAESGEWPERLEDLSEEQIHELVLFDEDGNLIPPTGPPPPLSPSLSQVRTMNGRCSDCAWTQAQSLPRVSHARNGPSWTSMRLKNWGWSPQKSAWNARFL